MSYFNTINLNPDTGGSDAFGRFRVSEIETLFDSKLIFDDAPLFWDESLVTGTGITSAHSTDTASVTLTSTLNTAGRFVRQTFQRFRYQPGRSQLVLMTGVLDPSGGGTGVERRMGLYDDDNGIFLEDNAGTIGLTRRTSTSGTPVDNTVAQASWNLDVMDGTGPSGITLDFTKTQILVIDYEWLGVGRVRVGFNVDGVTYYVHQFVHANILTDVYMSTPNLPLRYEMITTASSPASTLKCICSSVMSEGGQTKNGVERAQRSGAVGTIGSGVVAALVGIRHKTTATGAAVAIHSASCLSTSSGTAFYLELYLNPTVAGTFTYADLTNSTVQTATGAPTNTITGGTLVYSEAIDSSGGSGVELDTALRLGQSIAGTQDEYVLAVRAISNNITVHSTLGWRELD